MLYRLTEFLKTINLKTEILCGLTVALALVPEAVAFSFVAGVQPLVGLYAAFMVGLITSIFGGLRLHSATGPRWHHGGSEHLRRPEVSGRHKRTRLTGTR